MRGRSPARWRHRRRLPAARPRHQTATPSVLKHRGFPQHAAVCCSISHLDPPSAWSGGTPTRDSEHEDQDEWGNRNHQEIKSVLQHPQEAVLQHHQQKIQPGGFQIAPCSDLKSEEVNILMVYIDCLIRTSPSPAPMGQVCALASWSLIQSIAKVLRFSPAYGICMCIGTQSVGWMTVRSL